MNSIVRQRSLKTFALKRKGLVSQVTVDIVMKEELSQSDTIENTLLMKFNSPDNDKDISERNNSKDLLSF